MAGLVPIGIKIGNRRAKDTSPLIMAGLVPAIHIFVSTRKIVDDRPCVGHDR
jgi:hypothetical protein